MYIDMNNYLAMIFLAKVCYLHQQNGIPFKGRLRNGWGYMKYDWPWVNY